MKKACVIGHFGFGENMLNGQTIKTKIVTTELDRQLGVEQVMKIDTHGGIKALPKISIQMMKAFKNCKNIIILPAHNGVKIFVPLCIAFNIVFHRRIHYVVIGGWINDMLSRHKVLAKMLKKFSGIYVETVAIKNSLLLKNFKNIYVMPNFKEIRILSEEELVYSNEEPLRLCTFSRVMKEKGIEEAIEAVIYINKKYHRIVYILDIYGQIDEKQKEWFEVLKTRFPEFIKYRGLVPYDKSVEYLKSYYVLLFPTYYEGEGFAGTLIDAMAAGVPVIASNWKYNREIVIEEKTGFLIKAKDTKILEKTLEWALNNTQRINEMKRNCIVEAQKYRPKIAIHPLVKSIK